MGRIGLPLLFVKGKKKVLLEESDTHSFTYGLSPISHYKSSEVSFGQKSYGPQS